MCGITGIFSYNSGLKPSYEQFVRWSMGQMWRRGPDSDGYLKLGDAMLGFRRLAIRDTHERANQPMYDNIRDCALVYNGEIYNTAFLKSKLPVDIEFVTSSDTEVLFKCLIHLGVAQTIPLLDGIFAFAFYDATAGQLTLARDRAGIKPLYYGINEDILIFCSEYSHILCHEAFTNTSINPDALGQYLQLGFVPDGEHIFRNTFLLPHGHYLLVYKGENPVLKCFYNYDWHVSKDAQPVLNDVIAESVESQLVSDVPIGVFQSGGIDSSLVCWHSKKYKYDLESFTIGVKESKEIDESEQAQAFANFIGIQNNLRQINTDSLKVLIAQNIEAFSEPFADYSSLPTLMLSQFAREKITVALSGDGGDELFWGYTRNVHAVNVLPALKGNITSRLFHLIKNRISNSNKKIPLRSLIYTSILDYAYKKVFITGAHGWVKQIMRHEPAAPFFLQKLQETLDDISSLSDIELMNILRKVEFDFHLQRVLLKVDRASLYHSLEVRVPLLSNEMVKASQSYFYNDCIQDSMGKVPLRSTLKNYAGDWHSSLPKKGFTVPIDEWINSSLSNSVYERLMNIPEDFAPFFDKNGIESLLKSQQNQKNGWLIWALFTLFEWSDKILRRQKADYLKL